MDAGFVSLKKKGSPPSILRLAICLDGPPVAPSKQHRIHQQIESNEDLAQERRKCAWRLTPFGYRWWWCKKNTETVATDAFWNKMSIAVMFHSHALLPPNHKMSDLYKLAGLDCLDYEGKQKTSETQGINAIHVCIMYTYICICQKNVLQCFVHRSESFESQGRSSTVQKQKFSVGIGRSFKQHQNKKHRL